jgi:predicted transcriptional regulator
MSDKELVIDRIRHLPETASVSQIVEELQILAAIQEGEKAADEGRTKTHEEVKELLAAWTAK